MNYFLSKKEKASPYKKKRRKETRVCRTTKALYANYCFSCTSLPLDSVADCTACCVCVCVHRHAQAITKDEFSRDSRRHVKDDNRNGVITTPRIELIKKKDELYKTF